MVTTQAGTVLRHVRRLLTTPAADARLDRQLVEAFTARRDEAAFATLVRRHGPLVLGVCRRVLGNSHDAEDAFQATFLVLARKAGSIRARDSVAGWLYQVAHHVAGRARGQLATRQRHERRTACRRPADPLAEVTGRELMTALDEELLRLDEKHRTPLVLCYLESHTRDEAARRLGCSPSTLKRRLEEGQERLRARLARRGLALGAALLVAGLGRGVAAAVPAGLAAVAARAALSASAAALSPRAAALADGAVRAIGAARIKAAVLFMAVTLSVLAAGTLTHLAAGGPVAQVTETPMAAEEKPTKPAAPAGRPAEEESEKMTVTGRVLDADGKPVAAAVAVLGNPKRPSADEDEQDGHRLLGQGTADADGRFRLTVPRTASSRYYSTWLIASAPGHGLSWDDFDPDAERPEVALRLGREQVLRCRVVDLQGAPAAKVELRVESAYRENGRGTSAPSRGVHAWPAPVTADAEGRFVLRGFSAEQRIFLEVRDARFARRHLEIAANAKDRAAEMTFPLPPPQVLTGRVTRADTGKPMANARVAISGPGHSFHARTDADGRYEVPVSDTKCVYVSAAPPDGESYLVVKKSEDWPKGVVRHAIDLALPRGIVVTGKVVEAGSGKPLAGADVQYFPQLTDNHDRNADVASLSGAAVASGPGGEFRIVLPPGPAHLLVNAAAPDYVYKETTFGALAQGQPDSGSYMAGPEGNAYFTGQRVYAQAVVPVKLKRGAEPEPLTVTLRRGVTVRGRLLGADGKPAARARMLSRLNVSIWEHMMQSLPVEVYGGRFELRGCDPKATYRVIFYDPIHEQGAVAEIAGKEADGEPVTVRLAPCGTAKLRLLSGGQPLKNKRVKIDLIVTPGGSGFDGKEGPLADMAWLSNFDHSRYGRGPRTDGEGRLTLPALVPGATYRIEAGSRYKDYVVEAGKTVDWGDIDGAIVFDE
jgi:RNA polymerase sigma factor (sigma-70 family)